MKYLIKSVKQIRVRREKNRGPACFWVGAVVLAVFLHSLGVRLCAQSSPGPLAVTLINPQAIAFDPASGKVYVVDSRNNVVHVIDDATGSTLRVTVGSEPVSIVLNSGRLYVANSGDGTVSVIDGSTDAVIATIKAGAHPYSIAANSVTGKVYVSHTFSDQITVIDSATNTAANVTAGSFDLVVVNSKTDTTYMLGYEGGNLALLDGSGRKAKETTLGMHAWGMALDAASGNVFVARTGNAEVDVISPSSSLIKAVPTGAIPCAVAINSETNIIYVANYGDNTVTAIDGTTFKVVATIPVGNRPEALAVDPSSNTIYAANTKSDSVTVIDGGRNIVRSTLPAGKHPYALAVNPRSRKLHVANLSDSPFTTIGLP